MNNTRPSFYLISSAVDGNVNAIEKILALYMYLFQIVLRELIKSLDQNETFC